MSPSITVNWASKRMSVALFFITHEGIAANLLKVGEAIIRKSSNNISYLEVPMDSVVDKVLDDIDDKIKRLDIDDGILFITDIYGSTPGNIAHECAIKHNASLISGANLPMIIRLLNYRDETEQNLLKKALDGAHQGIQHYTTNNIDQSS